MKIPAKQFGKFLDEITKGKDKKEIHDILRKFVKLADQHGMLGKEKEIISSYRKMYNQRNSIVEGQVISSFSLSEEEREMVKNAIKILSKARSVELEEKKDSSLIGGFRCMFDGNIFDASIASFLDKLQSHIQL